MKVALISLLLRYIWMRIIELLSVEVPARHVIVKMLILILCQMEISMFFVLNANRV